MPNAFMASSLLTAIACVSLAGFATARFMEESDDCISNPAACIGQSVSRGRNAVTEVVNNWE